MELLGVLLSLEEKEREKQRWRIPQDATPLSDWAAVLGGSWASPNYSRLVTSWGRRWRSSLAGTINQRRLACSQGDWREVFKAGEEKQEGRRGRGGEKQHMFPRVREERLCIRWYLSLRHVKVSGNLWEHSVCTWCRNVIRKAAYWLLLLVKKTRRKAVHPLDLFIIQTYYLQ